MRNIDLRVFAGALAYCGLTVLSAGCSQQQEVYSYTITRDEPDRILAALIERPDDIWTFKMSGPAAVVDPQVDAVRKFLTTVHFADPTADLEWTLPEGWKQKPGDKLRFATIEIPSPSGPVELAVAQLPRPEPQEGERPRDFSLENLNRWRRQLFLPPMERGQVPTKVEMLPYEGALGYLAHWSGTLRPTNPAMAGGMPSGHPPVGPMPGPPAATSSNSAPSGPPKAAAAPSGPPKAGAAPLEYKLPEGWSEAPNDTFSLMAFEAADGDKKARVTISKLGPGAGGLAPNVNRWRGQLGLPPLASEDEIKGQSQAIDVGGQKGLFMEISSPEGTADRQTILGVIASDPEGTLFVKLKGDAALAEREKERFQEFVRSLAPKKGGEDHGD